MANYTTNLGLKKPVDSEGFDIADFNGNADKIDAAFGAGFGQGGAASVSKAIAKLDSDVNTTNDILADAVNCTSTTFFKGSGSSYTGAIPINDLKKGTFIVLVSGSRRYIIGVSEYGDIASISYSNSQWSNWAVSPRNGYSTTDVLASALNCSNVTFFHGSGSDYTGTLPANSGNNYKYGTFLVQTRSSRKNVIAVGKDGNIAVNAYDDSYWTGWQELALNSNITNLMAWETSDTEITTDYGKIYFNVRGDGLKKVKFALSTLPNSYDGTLTSAMATKYRPIGQSFVFTGYNNNGNARTALLRHNSGNIDFFGDSESVTGLSGIAIYY